MPKDRLPQEFGVDDRNFPQNYVGQLAYPFKPQTEAAVTVQQAAPR